MERSQKETLVASFRESITAANAIVLAGFSGLTVAEAADLRSKFRDAGVHFRVIKNTLAKRAIEETDCAVLSDALQGPTAWAYSEEDPVAPAKLLVDFIKDSGDEEHIQIKLGYLSGKTLSAEEVTSLAKLPGKDELRSRLLSLFNANATQFVRVLAAGPGEFLNLLTARKQSLDG
jgi:large subunit ribosomal protein L10